MKDKINWYKQTIKEEFKIWWIQERNEIKSLKKWWKQIPNFLSSVRLFIAPLLPFFVLYNVELGIILAIIGASTDCLDGFFARTLNAYSKFGEKLDTLADKLFSLSSIISISCLIGISAFKTSIFNLKSLLFISLIGNIINEFIIGKINVDAFLKKKKAKSSLLGKLKTWPLFMTIIFSLITAFAQNIASILNSLNLFDIASFVESSNMLITTLSLSLTTFVLQIITAKNYQKKYNKEEEHDFKIIQLNEVKKELQEEKKYTKNLSFENSHEKENTKEKVLTLKKYNEKRF